MQYHVEGAVRDKHAAAFAQRNGFIVLASDVPEISPTPIP
jgi:hypothetical protein